MNTNTIPYIPYAYFKMLAKYGNEPTLLRVGFAVYDYVKKGIEPQWYNNKEKRFFYTIIVPLIKDQMQ